MSRQSFTIPSILMMTMVAVVFALGCQSNRMASEAPIFSSPKPAPESESVDGSVQTASFHQTSESTLAPPNQSPIDSAADSIGPISHLTSRESQAHYLGSSRPRSQLNSLPESTTALTLEEAIAIALIDTKVLRSLSADLVRNAPNAASIYDPAIRGTDANFGVQAALAQFDSIVSGSAIYANNDDYFNNPVTTGNAFEVQQDLTTMNFGWNRVGLAGTQYSINQILTHDNTDNPSVLFPSSWDHQLEATMQVPLLQGRGRLFNEIAGPNARPGFLGTSGIAISRTNHEISLGDFQRGVRDLIQEIVSAYWQLDLAFRNYETIKAARDASYETWQIARARYKNGLPGGEADREAEARGQYYQFESQLDRALNATASNGSPGVLQAEANLRRLLNLPVSDGDFIQPSDQPSNVGSILDWNQLAQQALANRIEIRQQQTRIRQTELTLIAAKNFLLPRLDAIGTYRNSGLGDSLVASGGQFAGAWNEAWDGNYDEWEFGFSFNAPVGFRQAKSGVKNAELQAARERAVFAEMQQQVLHNLGTAFRDVEQSARRIHLAKLRRDALKDTVQSRNAAYEADAVDFEELLQAQRLYLESELDLHTAKTDREQSMARVYLESGSLLDEFSITLH